MREQEAGGEGCVSQEPSETTPSIPRKYPGAVTGSVRSHSDTTFLNYGIHSCHQTGQHYQFELVSSALKARQRHDQRFPRVERLFWKQHWGQAEADAGRKMLKASSGQVHTGWALTGAEWGIVRQDLPRLQHQQRGVLAGQREWGRVCRRDSSLFHLQDVRGHSPRLICGFVHHVEGMRKHLD